jgi:hypothetical protein
MEETLTGALILRLNWPGTLLNNGRDDQEAGADARNFSSTHTDLTRMEESMQTIASNYTAVTYFSTTPQTRNPAEPFV